MSAATARPRRSVLDDVTRRDREDRADDTDCIVNEKEDGGYDKAGDVGEKFDSVIRRDSNPGLRPVGRTEMSLSHTQLYTPVRRLTMHSPSPGEVPRAVGTQFIHA